MYLDVISSWCYWAIPAWLELRERYSDRVDFQWKIALMDKTGLPPTRAHTEWYYKRSGMLMRSPRMLNASWVEPNATEYVAPNCVAEAGRDFGIEDDRIWMALCRAELHDGKKIGRWDVAVEVGAHAAGSIWISYSSAPSRLRLKRVSEKHCGISRAPSQPAPYLRDRYANRRSRSFLRFCQSRSNRRNPRCDVGRHHRIRAYAAHFGDPPA
jgi:hypothetical protein